MVYALTNLLIIPLTIFYDDFIHRSKMTEYNKGTQLSI